MFHFSVGNLNWSCGTDFSSISFVVVVYLRYDYINKNKWNMSVSFICFACSVLFHVLTCPRLAFLLEYVGLYVGIAYLVHHTFIPVFQVLNPCSMNFSYSTPASDKGGQDIAIYLEAMRFEFSPGLLATVSNVIKELTGQREVCLFFRDISFP